MDDNLRRGNNTENLGLHLLRAIGAVAPVPRDQDIGIDAIVTLLKRDHGRRLVSGSTVFVQLKASSVRKIVFDPDDLKWLRRLELPYFIGSVSAADASIALYTVHHAIRLVGTKAVTAELCLDVEPGCLNPPIVSMEELKEWVKNDARKRVIAKVWLGPPVLDWKLSDSNNAGFNARSNDVMESWVAVLHENRLLEAVGETPAVAWKTGTKPEQTGSASLFRAGDKSREPAVRLFNITLKRVSMEAALSGEIGALQSLLAAATDLKHHGVDDQCVIAAGLCAKLANRPR